MARRPQVKITLPEPVMDLLDRACEALGLGRSDYCRAVLISSLIQTPWSFLGAPHGGPSWGTGPSGRPQKGDQGELPLSSGAPHGGPSGRTLARARDLERSERERSGSLPDQRGPESAELSTVQRLTAQLTECVNGVAGTSLDPASPAAVRALGLRLGHQVGGERLEDGDRPDSYSSIEDTCRGIAERWSPDRITLTAILGEKYWERHAQARAPAPRTPPPRTDGERRVARWADRKEGKS